MLKILAESLFWEGVVAGAAFTIIIMATIMAIDAAVEVVRDHRECGK